MPYQGARPNRFAPGTAPVARSNSIWEVDEEILRADRR